MIVVADSGSTKTDWRLVDTASGETVRQLKTIGFNPYFQSTQFIHSTLENDFQETMTPFRDKVTAVYYYGAGCSAPDKNEIVKNALFPLFPNAAIHIEHDLIGASRACLGDEEGIACILGTGANSCLWNGEKVLENIPSHGYIFGDEGSGAYLGKELLKLYLNREMDEEMRITFEHTFHVDEQEILERTYKGSSPNVFLASFAGFYSMFPNSDELRKLIRFGFNDFFNRRVIKYQDYQTYNIGFVGSIAYYYRDDLEKIAQMHHLNIKSVNKCPVEKLVQYHLEKTLTDI